MIKLIETPRDAMQGIKTMIPTSKKVEFLNALLKVGFHTLDFGSFVSPKAIPQMQDTAEVVEQLDLSQSNTHLLAIIGNKRGAEMASHFPMIRFLGYPYSISESFLKLNINSNFEKSFNQVAEIQEICLKNNQELVIYISNAFGNIYGDRWDTDLLLEHVEKLVGLGINIIPLSDTSGIGQPSTINAAFKATISNFPEIEFGAHLHTHRNNWRENVNAAYEAGCKRFDAVINGLGGCPMTGKKLVGNLQTFDLLRFLDEQNEPYKLNMSALNQAIFLEASTFPIVING